MRLAIPEILALIFWIGTVYFIWWVVKKLKNAATKQDIEQVEKLYVTRLESLRTEVFNELQSIKNSLNNPNM